MVCDEKPPMAIAESIANLDAELIIAKPVSN
jgi:hypothetical protein